MSWFTILDGWSLLLLGMFALSFYRASRPYRLDFGGMRPS